MYPDRVIRPRFIIYYSAFIIQNAEVRRVWSQFKEEFTT